MYVKDPLFEIVKLYPQTNINLESMLPGEQFKCIHMDMPLLMFQKAKTHILASQNSYFGMTKPMEQQT